MSGKRIRVLIAEVAARGIKRCSPKTRVLALSAGEDRETVLEMLESGADGYLMKGSPTATILSELGVRYGQGSFFARPGPLPLLMGAAAAQQEAAA